VAIAYYTVFSLLAVLLIVIAVAGLAFGADAARGALVDEISSLMGRQGSDAVQTMIAFSWLRVSSITKMPQIDHGVGHQLHTVMALLFELKAQQQPFEFILPREGPLHA
jgi:hypothetical protein